MGRMSFVIERRVMRTTTVAREHTTLGSVAVASDHRTLGRITRAIEI
jgi:hypothetical protein